MYRDHKIKVVIADRHPRVRSETSKWLATVPDLAVVGLAATGTEAIDLAAQADFLLLDMDLEQPPAVDVIRRLRSDTVQLRIIALCSECGSDYVALLLQLGVEACMLKEDGPGLFPEAIYQVDRGYRGLIMPASEEEPEV